ncbi:hypothetical protein l13_11110 [Neisseria weaveri ATCC 51223]|nr:hypothetical protein l13_11110 [Neisseria weaveri ATCC 51223]
MVGIGNIFRRPLYRNKGRLKFVYQVDGSMVRMKLFAVDGSGWL